MDDEFYDGKDLSGTHLIQNGPVVVAKLRPPRFIAAHLIAHGQEVVELPIKLVIDTGAFATGVDVSAMRALRLNPVRYATVFGIDRVPNQYGVYQCELLLPLVKRDGTSRMLPFPISAVGLPHHHGTDPNHNGLLGRDFLSSFAFAYHGPEGRFQLRVLKQP